jgi:hypothetical protein
MVDFGAVDWGKIWGDRHLLVSSQHLLELNSISSAAHLSNPGYWRNLFSSYTEVIDNAGSILQRYKREGVTTAVPTVWSYNVENLPPQAMNAYVDAKRLRVQQEVEEMRRYSDENRTKIIARNAINKIPVLNSVVNIGEKILDTGENLAGTVSNLTGAARNLTNNLGGNGSSPWSGMFENFGYVAIAVGGVVLYSLLK